MVVRGEVDLAAAAKVEGERVEKMVAAKVEGERVEKMVAAKVEGVLVAQEPLRIGDSSPGR